jgi:hypothetical protein
MSQRDEFAADRITQRSRHQVRVLLQQFGH